MRPFRLTPVFKPKPWGGRRLHDLGRPAPVGDIGESWELADLPTAVAHDGRTKIATGRHRGRTLRDVIEADRVGLLGTASPWPDGNFPLLVKLLDARQNLSVQVHPDEAYAAAHPPAVTKAECWFVVAAEPGSMIFSGLVDGVSSTDLLEAAGTPAVVPLLRRLPAIPGQWHDMPAGTMHALGAGVMVAEVQTPSDTTYRVYDWSAEYGRKPRALHLIDAAAATDRSSRPEPIAAMPDGLRCAISTRYYSVFELAGVRRPSRPERLSVVMTVAGTVVAGQEALTFGNTLVVPASADELTIDATAGRCLIITIGADDE